jgi:hypothetical protein
VSSACVDTPNVQSAFQDNAKDDEIVQHVHRTYALYLGQCIIAKGTNGSQKEAKQAGNDRRVILLDTLRISASSLPGISGSAVTYSRDTITLHHSDIPHGPHPFSGDGWLNAYPFLL